MAWSIRFDTNSLVMSQHVNYVLTLQRICKILHLCRLKFYYIQTCAHKMICIREIYLTALLFPSELSLLCLETKPGSLTWFSIIIPVRNWRLDIWYCNQMFLSLMLIWKKELQLTRIYLCCTWRHIFLEAVLWCTIENDQIHLDNQSVACVLMLCRIIKRI
jgi:hypothetical protein